MRSPVSLKVIPDGEGKDEVSFFVFRIALVNFEGRGPIHADRKVLRAYHQSHPHIAYRVLLAQIKCVYGHVSNVIIYRAVQPGDEGYWNGIFQGGEIGCTAADGIAFFVKR